MNQPHKQQGFGLVEIIIAIVIVALVAVGGWYVWSANQKPQPTASGNPAGANQTPPPAPKTFSLASGKVTFNLPEGWSTSNAAHLSGEACMIGSTACIDQTTIFPGTTGAIGGDTKHPKYIGTAIAVYKHADNTTAKDWWEQHHKEESAPLFAYGDLRDPSTAKIGDYDAYSFKLDAGTFADMCYVIATKDYVLFIDSEAKGAGVNGTDDFSDYLPVVKGMAGTLRVQ